MYEYMHASTWCSKTSNSDWLIRSSIHSFMSAQIPYKTLCFAHIFLFIVIFFICPLLVPRLLHLIAKMSTYDDNDNDNNNDKDNPYLVEYRRSMKSCPSFINRYTYNNSCTPTFEWMKWMNEWMSEQGMTLTPNSATVVANRTRKDAIGRRSKRRRRGGRRCERTTKKTWTQMDSKSFIIKYMCICMYVCMCACVDICGCFWMKNAFVEYLILHYHPTIVHCVLNGILNIMIH